MTKTHSLAVQKTPIYKQLNPAQRDIVYFFETLSIGYPKWEEKIAPADLAATQERLITQFSTTQDKTLLAIELQKVLARLEDGHTRMEYVYGVHEKVYPLGFMAYQYSSIIFKPTAFATNKAYHSVLMPKQDMAYIKVGTFLDYEMIKDGIGDYVRNPLFRVIGKSFMKKRLKKVDALDFKTFFSQAIAQANGAKVNNVVIDLRGNSGGDMRLASEMFYLLGVDTMPKLYRLTEKISDYSLQQMKREYREKGKFYEKTYGKPLIADGSLVYFDSLMDSHYADFFNLVKQPSKPTFYIAPHTPRFKGKIYFLINPHTFSAASMTASLVKDNHLGTLVGIKTGNRPTTATGALAFKLPNLKIPVNMSYLYVSRPDPTKPNEDGIMPDVEVWQTLEDGQKGIDTVMDWVKKDIQSRKKVGLVGSF